MRRLPFRSYSKISPRCQTEKKNDKLTRIKTIVEICGVGASLLMFLAVIIQIWQLNEQIQTQEAELSLHRNEQARQDSSIALLVESNQAQKETNRLQREFNDLFRNRSKQDNQLFVQENKPQLDAKIDCSLKDDTIFLYINLVNLGKSRAENIKLSVLAKSNSTSKIWPDSMSFESLNPGHTQIATIFLPKDSMNVALKVYWIWPFAGLTDSLQFNYDMKIDDLKKTCFCYRQPNN